MPRRSYRPLIIGRNGAVASNHPLATQAGLDVLRAGGNAIDATIAMGFAIGVVEPHMSGIGGDSFYNVFLARGARNFVVNATGGAPDEASATAFAQGMPNWGPRSISTPGTVAGLAALHAAHGQRPWADLLKPAIVFAREGFGVTHAYRHFTRQERERLCSDTRSREIFLPTADASPAAIGTTIRQPELATTLEEIAADKGESFYRGNLADRIVTAVRERGGLLSREDLAACQPEIKDPIRIRYRDFEVTQTPPNSTGFVLLQMLKIVERFNLSAAGEESPDAIHALVEAKKMAFLDRERYGQDPRFGEVPVEHLLSEKYADECFNRINFSKAMDISPTVSGRGDTTYFCVVDADGNAVSAIQSLNLAFGSGVIAGDTGVLMNNRMAYWHLEPRHANFLMPHKRVRHTMNAPIVFKDGKLWCVFGTPGADNQVQVNLQILTSMIDFGLDPQQAVEAPRWSSNQPGQDSNYPHPGELALSMEARFDPATVTELAKRGHRILPLGELDGPCNVEAIRVDGLSGNRIAGSDPRRDGWALAY